MAGNLSGSRLCQGYVTDARNAKDAYATVTGDNPWDVDTHKYGVKLRARWDESSLELSVIVTDKSFLAPCKKIWEYIDDVIHHIQEIPEAEIE